MENLALLPMDGLAGHIIVTIPVTWLQRRTGVQVLEAFALRAGIPFNGHLHDRHTTPRRCGHAGTLWLRTRAQAAAHAQGSADLRAGVHGADGTVFDLWRRLRHQRRNGAADLPGRLRGDAVHCAELPTDVAGIPRGWLGVCLRRAWAEQRHGLSGGVGDSARLSAGADPAVCGRRQCDA